MLDLPELAGSVADSLPADVAALDANGVIVWANASWLRATRSGSDVPVVGTVGENLLHRCHAIGSPFADAVGEGVAAVISGASRGFEREFISTDGSRHWRVLASPLRGSFSGAVVISSEVTGRWRQIRSDPGEAADLAGRIAELTARERDVLGRMVRGLANREIAEELSIGYATVRTHVQSIIEKLGARSRLQAVARAYRAGIAEELG